MSLSDLPDDILNLISIRLNGFDNCSLWMASDSKLRQRLVNNVITDFDVNYTIPGRYIWPGNFLKKLKRLSRLSLVVDEYVFHLPIENIELFAIPTLKHLQLVCYNALSAFEQTSDPTDPTSSPHANFINLNDFYNDLEYLKVKSNLSQQSLSIDFLRCLPQKLKTLLIPQHRFILTKKSTESCVDRYLEVLPPGLTSLEIHFLKPSNVDKASMLAHKLPNSLTSLSSNLHLEPDRMLPENLKELNLVCLYTTEYNIDKFTPFLPVGLERLSIMIDSTNPSGESLSRFKNLKRLEIIGGRQLQQFITSSLPNLEQFRASSIILQNLQTPLFKEGITTVYLYRVKGIKIDFFDKLPQSVTSLTLVSHTSDLPDFPFFSKLPKNLRYLHTNLSVNEGTYMLPDTLAHLNLASQHNTKVDRLPSKLETLILDSIILQSIVELLPATLTHLDINGDVVFDDIAVPKLPRGLKYLRCGRDKITDASSGLFPPNLETLILDSNEYLTDASISNLPRSLTRIELKDNSNLTDDCIPNLPPKLIRLHLPRSRQITSQSRKDLPRYLRRS